MRRAANGLAARMRWLVCGALALALAGASVARAEPAGDAVALLPLDAEKRLEIYGQPVASELARALAAGNIAVVVVGPKMAVPAHARLIIDGTITVGKAGAVTVALRLRHPQDGVVLETLSATAPGLAKIDAAAAELSTRILPLVRDRLAEAPRPPTETTRPASPQQPAQLSVLVAIGDPHGIESGALFAGALDDVVAGWLAVHHRALHKLSPDQLVPAAVAAGGADFAIRFDVVAYEARSLAPPGGEPALGAIPLARARVRVQIIGPRGALFDRVIATDTVVGERGQSAGSLAARVAREVLAIVRPHLRRSVPAWPG